MKSKLTRLQRTRSSPEQNTRSTGISQFDAVLQGGKVLRSRPAVSANEPLKRMDVVAHAWGVKRQAGEDDEHLMARIRRATVNIPKMYRPSEPPEDWNPPPGFRIGDAIP